MESARPDRLLLQRWPTGITIKPPSELLLTTTVVQDSSNLMGPLGAAEGTDLDTGTLDADWVREGSHLLPSTSDGRVDMSETGGDANIGTPAAPRWH